ncbi:MAG: hypothetical protein ACXQTS_06675 [Candidatus Methanospirareceae archaeon]
MKVSCGSYYFELELSPEIKLSITTGGRGRRCVLKYNISINGLSFSKPIDGESAERYIKAIEEGKIEIIKKIMEHNLDPEKFVDLDEGRIDRAIKNAERLRKYWDKRGKSGDVTSGFNLVKEYRRKAERELEEGKRFFKFGERLVFIRKCEFLVKNACVYVFDSKKKEAYTINLPLSTIYKLFFKKKPKRIPKRLLKSRSRWKISIHEFQEEIKRVDKASIPEDCMPLVAEIMLSA